MLLRGAESGALDAELAALVAAWPTLTDPIRAAIRALVAAFGLLKLVPLAIAAPAGPTEPDEIVRKLVMERREQAEKDRQREVDDDNDEDYDEQYDITPVPSVNELTARVWRELEGRLNAPEPQTAEPSELISERTGSGQRTAESTASAVRKVVTFQ